MHEVSLALEVLDHLAHNVNAQGPLRIVRVTLRVGALSGVDSGALRFALEGLAAGTLIEGARVDIEEIPGSAWCSACESRRPIEFRLSPCPVCGHYPLSLPEGTELVIESVDVAECS
jgi:hydrogenase nickel incorporation protein HypA/HybF